MAIEAKDDPRAFLVGRTGAGKSALINNLETGFPQHVIRISPEDLSLPYIADLTVIRYLTDLNVHLDPLYIALWKHVLLIEVIKNRYSVDTPAAKQNFMRTLRDRIARDKSKAAALEYLEDFEGKFWCETDERVRDITTRFEQQIKAEAGGRLEVAGLGSATGGLMDSNLQSRELKSQYSTRFQRIVNDTQLPRLNKMMSVLDEDVLDSDQHFTYVVIDDLDRDWADEAVANALIRCLFRAVVDLKRVRRLKVIVALRANIFEALDFGSRSGGQEEKFRSLTMRHRWTEHDLEQLLNERARAAAAKHGLEGIHGVKDLLPASNRSRGSALKYILRRTLMRPRDAIAYFNECYDLNGGKPKIGWETIHAAENGYSRKRLLALRDEWKPNYPGVDQVFDCFTDTPVRLSPEEVIRRLDDAACLLLDEHFTGSAWLSRATANIWADSDSEAQLRPYHPLIRLLFEIGFLGTRRPQGGSLVWSTDDPDYFSVARNIDGCEEFFVHPAFRATLGIRHEKDLSEIGDTAPIELRDASADAAR